MANKTLIDETLTPIVWADTTDYAGDGGTRTHQIDLTSLAAAAARQGAKADLADATYSGVANRRPRLYTVTLRVEFDVAPADDKTVDLYMGGSLSGTAATANPGGLTGADAAYTGTAGSTLAESLLQLQKVLTLSCTNDAATVVQQQSAIWMPKLRYNSPVVVNNADQAFEGDAVEMSITLTALIPELQ